MNVLGERVSVSIRSILPVRGSSDQSTRTGLADVDADIFLDDSEIDRIGSIQAVLVNRRHIQENHFHETFLEYSGTMEWVGSALLENRYGRTRLESLYKYDTPENDFMFITSIRVLDESSVKNSTEIAASALYMFLREFLDRENASILVNQRDDFHPVVCAGWQVSSAAYVLRHFNNEIHPEQEEDKEVAARMEAEPFLRNGFFQDPALIQEDMDNQRLLVASCGHWDKPPMFSKSQTLLHKKVNFALSIPPKPSVKDRSILRAVERLVVVRDPYDVMPDLFSDLMTGRTQYKPPRDPVSAQQIVSLRKDLFRLKRMGGSIARSTALHTACKHNSPSVVKLLLELEPTAVDARGGDNNTASSSSYHHQLTPLMVAAKNASERCSIYGIDDTEIIDHLLSCGAKTDITDSIAGMTAYGYFHKTISKQLLIAGGMTCVQGLRKICALENKLRPPTGPTLRAMTRGKANDGSGIIDYGLEDAETRRKIW